MEDKSEKFRTYLLSSVSLKRFEVQVLCLPNLSESSSNGRMLALDASGYEFEPHLSEMLWGIWCIGFWACKFVALEGRVRIPLYPKSHLARAVMGTSAKRFFMSANLIGVFFCYIFFHINFSHRILIFILFSKTTLYFKTIHMQIQKKLNIKDIIKLFWMYWTYISFIWIFIVYTLHLTQLDLSFWSEYLIHKKELWFVFFIWFLLSWCILFVLNMFDMYSNDESHKE